MKLLSLMLLASCASGQLPAPARAGAPDTRIVDHVWYNPQPGEWRRSPWFRQGVDDVTPVRIVISTDDSACIMGTEVDEPLPLTYHACPTGWRYARARGR